VALRRLQRELPRGIQVVSLQKVGPIRVGGGGILVENVEDNDIDNAEKSADNDNHGDIIDSNVMTTLTTVASTQELNANGTNFNTGGTNFNTGGNNSSRGSSGSNSSSASPSVSLSPSPVVSGKPFSAVFLRNSPDPILIAPNAPVAASSTGSKTLMYHPESTPNRVRISSESYSN
jgi:hypothetical protein